jgi:HK97 family phage major capsid protein
MNEIELRRERARLITEARQLNERAEAEGRGLEATEKDSFEKLWAAQKEIEERLNRAAEVKAAEGELAQVESRTVRADVRPEAVLDRYSPEVRAMVEPMVKKFPTLATRDYADGFRSYLRTGEMRAAQVTPDTQGGYMVPTDFIASLMEKVRDAVFIRQLATNYTLTTGDSVGRPTIETDVADAAWTSEIGAVSEDSSLAFGKRELHPHDLTKLVKVSRKLLRSSAINPETVVRDQLAYKFGITEEKAFLTGNGAGQPLGVFVASNDGIPTTRDISAGNATTSIGADGLIAAKYALKDGYLRSPSCRWLFHRDGIKQIQQLKDGEGQYLFNMDLRSGAGDTVLGIPVLSSEFVPNTFTSALYVGIIGDFSYYWVATALNLTVQRLVELYAANGQDGFIGRHAVDGMPVFGEAFARVKLA